MATESIKLTVPPDSNLARCLKTARDYLDVDTGDAVYRLYVGRRDAPPLTPVQVSRVQEGIRRAAGGWKGLVDAEAFKSYVAERRRTGSRPSICL